MLSRTLDAGGEGYGCKTTHSNPASGWTSVDLRCALHLPQPRCEMTNSDFFSGWCCIWIAPDWIAWPCAEWSWTATTSHCNSASLPAPVLVRWTATTTSYSPTKLTPCQSV